MRDRRAPRVSIGGQVVASSLLAAGFQPTALDVAMVETAPPTRRYRVVLVQSAWNVISWDEFRRLIRPYPPRMQTRAVLRRRVARANLRRAERVVCLTHAIAQVLYENTGITATIAAVTLPMDTTQARVPGTAGAVDRFALVPGTITWFKRPVDALQWVHLHGAGSIDRVLFCGSDDGSGCWQRVREVADRLGVVVTRELASRERLNDLYVQARATILPSELESLGFALSEALLLSPRVIARPVPSHLELATRVGRQPEWGFACDPSAADISVGPLIDHQHVERQWVGVGEVLGLPRSESMRF